MRGLFAALVLICAPTAGFAQDKTSAEVADQVIGYADTDARMNGAIEQARALLPMFLAEFRTATTQARSAFTLKAGLPTASGSREHIWIGELRYEGEQLIGNLINEPYDLPEMRMGSRVEIRVEDISDWTIATPDGVYGGFTTRVMIEDMPPEQAALYRSQLQLTASPTPPGWIQ